jgi:hypothetical protein
MKLGVMRRPSPSRPHIDQARPDFSSGFALFNKRIEVIDQSVSVQTVIDIENRTGPLGPLWKLTEVTDVAKLEMDEDSFRILLTDGTVVRSQNVIDVRKPDLAQVEFWTPDPDH